MLSDRPDPDVVAVAVAVTGNWLLTTGYCRSLSFRTPSRVGSRTDVRGGEESCLCCRTDLARSRRCCRGCRCCYPPLPRPGHPAASVPSACPLADARYSTRTMALTDQLCRFVDRHGGVLPLKPCLVPRGYRGGGRLAGKGPGMVRRRDGKYLVERWIASSTRAGWGDPNTQNGLSHLAEFRPATRLADALQALPDVLLGPAPGTRPREASSAS